jgi:4-alpha-glucanotransferase
VNQDWIVHNSHQPVFRSPFGAVCCNTDVTLRVNLPGKAQQVKLRLWQDGIGEKIVPMKLCLKNDRGVWYEVTESVPSEPCIVWYFFIIEHKGEVYYYGNNAAGLGGTGQVYKYMPPSFQITVYKEDAAVPEWFKHAVIYQIFPDRFYNGQADGRPLNPKDGSVIHASWHDVPFYIRDVETKEIFAYDFFGGNLAGIIAKLDYLKDMGVTAIYLNPIFESPSNHRYDTADYHKVDPVLGDNELLAGLCRKAGQMGIKVILDGVFSHTGSDSLYFNKNGRYPTLGAYQSQQSPYYKWYRFIEFPERYESWWGIDTLPNVEETEPSYLEFVVDGPNSVVKHWHQHGIKGWRLDVVDELPDIFIKRFAKKLKELDREAVIIGEVWEDASNKISYGKLRQYFSGDQLDSVMNYPFRQIVLDFLLGCQAAEQIHARLMSLYENYPRHNFYAAMNLLGSHDVPRVLTLLGGAPPADSMTISQQARYRLPHGCLELAVKRLKLAVLWQMTFPGVPSIYYGDEAGAEGYKDPFNRGTFPWGRENRDLLDWYKKMTALRHRHAALRTGEWLPVLAQGDVYAYIRRIQNNTDIFGHSQPNDVIMVVLNRSACRSVELEINVRPWCSGAFWDVVKEAEIAIEKGKVKLDLAPLEGKILLKREKPALKRGCGVLLHPVSLPSKYGIGDMGKEAVEFINFLYKGKQKLWQVLPLNPVGYGYSPYQGLSAFAGNHLIISLGVLVRQGLLEVSELKDCPVFDSKKIEYDKAAAYKESKLQLAYFRFKEQAHLDNNYHDFCQQNVEWLDDYALFMALKEYFGYKSWHEWPEEVAFRREDALAEYKKLLEERIGYHKFVQFVFYSQWKALKNYANRWGIQIIGDLPLFVSYDSSDVWANKDLFELDQKGRPLKVAGVPPDYFSKTGQLWGNPQYNWQKMKETGYLWWRERVKKLLELADIIRIDHFRGLEAYWEIPAGSQTAETGQWVKGPGAALFEALEEELGRLPFIAEDLGIITPEVEALREQFNLPGMKVLHFSCRVDRDAECRPFTCEKNTVVYTGTHDNDTMLGWFKKLKNDQPEMAEAIAQAVGSAGESDISWRMIELAYASEGNTVIIPLQDILGLDTEARMNTPGTTGGNWQWRCPPKMLTAKLAGELADLADKYCR